MSPAPRAPGRQPSQQLPVTIATIEQHATPSGSTRRHPPVLADITSAVVAEFHLSPGTHLYVTVKATETTTYPN